MNIKVTYPKYGGGTFDVEYTDIVRYEIVEEEKKIDPLKAFENDNNWHTNARRIINELVDAVNKLTEKNK